MTRVSQLLSTISSTTITSASDGRRTIGEGEAVRAARKLSLDSFGPASERSTAIASLTASPERFESMSAYGAFLRAANPSAYPTPLKATGVSVGDGGISDQHIISARIGGRWTPIGTASTGGGEPSALVAGSGRYVLWSTRGTAGGFEASGNALMSYDTRTGITSRVMDEGLVVSDLKEFSTPAGTTYIAAQLYAEGDDETTYTAIIDPARGELYSGTGSLMGSNANGIVIGEPDENGKLVRRTISFASLANAPVIHAEPDEFADAAMSQEDMLTAWSAGSASVIETTENAQVWDVVERLRAETETFAIANNYEASTATTLYTMDVTNESGATSTVFVVRQTLGEADILTFVDASGVVIHRQ